jgi:hydrogenase maturation protease
MCVNVQTVAALDVQIPGILLRGDMVTLRSRHVADDADWRATNLSHAWTASDPPAALILGFGNILLGDDGAGVQLVERLRAQLPGSACEFVDGGTMSFSLLSHVETANALLVIDAAELGKPAGATELFENEEMDGFLKSARRRTVHEVGLVDLLDMARLRDCLPHRRALLCIQPALIDWSESLSPAVEAAFGQASALARAVLARWNVI